MYCSVYGQWLNKLKWNILETAPQGLRAPKGIFPGHSRSVDPLRGCTAPPLPIHLPPPTRSPVPVPVRPAAKNRVCPVSHEIRKNRIRAGPRGLSLGNVRSRPTRHDAQHFMGPDGMSFFYLALKNLKICSFRTLLEKLPPM